MRYLAPVTAEFLVVLKDAATQRADSWKSPRQRGPKTNAQMSLEKPAVRRVPAGRTTIA
jgi:hypothetical protein